MRIDKPFAKAYLARRILRANPCGVTYRKLIKQADEFTLRLCEVLPEFLATECIAKAEQLAIQKVFDEMEKESK